MPRQYEHIRDSYIKRGTPVKEAKRIAAMTYNKLHPSNPNPWEHEAKDMKRRVRKG